LFKISSSLFFIFRSISACLSMSICLVLCFSKNFCSSLSFFSWSRAAFCRAYSSIFASYSSSFLLSSIYWWTSVSFAFLNVSFYSICFLFLSASFSASRWSSSCTWRLISSASRFSSWMRLIYFILNSCS
jgi:hypothetical protein